MLFDASFLDQWKTGPTQHRGVLLCLRFVRILYNLLSQRVAQLDSVDRSMFCNKYRELTFTNLWADSVDGKLMNFFLFSPEIYDQAFMQTVS